MEQHNHISASVLLAIDPGPTESAWVLWDGRHILDMAKEDNDALLGRIMRRTFRASPDDMVIERIASYGMAVGATVFETCVWTGRFMQAAALPGGCPRLERLKVKMHLCHDSKAKDANIRRALIDRFGEPGTKAKPGLLYGVKADIWAALAVAVTYWDGR